MLKFVILGVIQGLTEFLPVSSSGHLVIMQKVLGIGADEVALSVVLHLGTTLALIIFFLKDILGLLRNVRLMLLILTVTAITGLIGLGAKDFFESLFSSPRLVAIALVFTGIILLLTRKFMDNKKKDINFSDAFILGLAQAAAIVPGISRSGATISTLLFRRINWEESFKFSFLAAIPAVMGAALLEARKVDLALKADMADLLAGFIASLLTGIIALGILKRILKSAKFYYFGYYCIIVATIALIYLK
jgi:undecaprenyl-diphosphatase